MPLSTRHDCRIDHVDQGHAGGGGREDLGRRKREPLRRKRKPGIAVDRVAAPLVPASQRSVQTVVDDQLAGDGADDDPPFINDRLRQGLPQLDPPVDPAVLRTNAEQLACTGGDESRPAAAAGGSATVSRRLSASARGKPRLQRASPLRGSTERSRRPCS